jgi:hypothetical protein
MSDGTEADFVFGPAAAAFLNGTVPGIPAVCMDPIDIAHVHRSAAERINQLSD